MNTPIDRIKVPFGLIKIANEKKLLNVVKFYYGLKSLTIHGCFLDVDFIRTCQQHLLISYNTAKKYKATLLKNKFAIKKDSHFYLVSYDKFWKELGVEKEGKQFKLIYTSMNNFQDDIYLAEIKRNLRKQETTLQDKYIKQELKADTVKNASKGLKNALIKQLSYKSNELLEKQISTIRESLTSKLNINYQITLSCQKVANLFGFKSCVQGHFILKRLLSLNRISIMPQKSIKIASKITNRIFKILNLDTSFFLTSQNVLFKRLPNIISMN